MGLDTGMSLSGRASCGRARGPLTRVSLKRDDLWYGERGPLHTAGLPGGAGWSGEVSLDGDEGRLQAEFWGEVSAAGAAWLALPCPHWKKEAPT